jgi:peptidoglycan/LPS O-acetylase OafA/YrhL/peptidoglycan/xylan/chitin deacetylase (PgdA/CDA1 family)
VPRPVEGSWRYAPALDGLRALAVALVIGYHLGLPWMGGGLLGVGVFLTLTGFLVTGTLLSAWYHTGRLGLGRFYRRRARRVLPAVVVLVVAVLLTTLLVDRDSVGSVASRAFVGTWEAVAPGRPDAGSAMGRGPLEHLWPLGTGAPTLLLWPLLLLVLAALPWVTLRAAALVAGALAAVSFVLLWLHATPGIDTTRAYVGADTRAGGLLVGAALALLVWRPSGPPRLDGTPRRVLDRWALVGLGLIAVLTVLTTERSAVLFRGGLVLLSLATAVVIAVVVRPGSRVGAVLGLPPLAWVGERAYGIYLWHLPVIVFTPAAVLAERPLVRSAVLVGITVGLAALSWALVEAPLRRPGRRRRPSRDRPGAPGARRPVPAAAAAAGVLVLVATTALTVQAHVGGRLPAAVAAGAEGGAMPPSPDAVVAASGSAPRAPGNDSPGVPEATPVKQQLPVDGVDCSTAKCIALTFDDGPIAGTAQLLDVLRSRGAHATFFVVGRQAASRPDLLRRMVEEGHAVGNHSYTHADLTRLGASARDRELTRTSRVIEQATGDKPTLLRPPYGATNREVAEAAKALGMAQVLWDVDPLDWEDHDSGVVRDRVLAGAKPGAIVISHDSQATTRAAYAEIVDALIADGYLLVTVPELLGGAPKPGKVYAQG